MSDIRVNRWLHQSGTGGVYQDSTGRVGIGTSVPTSALDVQSGTIKIGNNTLSSSGVSTFSSGIVVSAGTTAAPSITPTGDSNTGIFFPSADTVCIGEGGTEVIRVNSSGNVGIGTNSPTGKLDLYATGGQLSVYLRNPNQNYGIRLDSDNNNSRTYDIYDITNSHYVDRYWQGASGYRSFYTNNIERVRIDSSGNIEARDGNSGFVAPSRRTISSVIRYGTGFSYRDSSDNIRPVVHVKVASLGGNGAANMGGAGVWVNGVNIGNTGRSWGLYVISGGGSNIGQLLVANTYDIYGSGAAQTNMINDIATYFTNDNVIIINTSDEPENNSATLRTTLRDTYGAKLSNTAVFRYAYCYAFRYGYGALAEQNSAHFEGATYTPNGNNARAIAGISFSVVL